MFTGAGEKLYNRALAMAAQLAPCNRSSFAGVAQLVEQRIRNAKVVGSTPISGTISIQKGQPIGCLFCILTTNHDLWSRQFRHAYWIVGVVIQSFMASCPGRSTCTLPFAVDVTQLKGM